MPFDTTITALKADFGDRCATSDAVRDHHANGEAYHAPVRPDAVLFPGSTEEVAQIMRTCAAGNCPIVPYGTGTSLEGHVVPLRGGVSLDMSRMDAILAIHPEDLDAVVQPGVTRRRLNEDLRDTGLFFPVDPGADASMGGMAATRASGTNAVRYGTMRENVLAVEAVMADGQIIRAGTRARKSSAGYDLTKLLVGSEGTLGIITELTLRLYGQPEAVASGVCTFDSVEGAVDAVILTIQSGLPVARIEFLDELQIRAVNNYSKLSLSEKPTLFLEVPRHGCRSCRAIGTLWRDRAGVRRRHLRLGDPGRGPQPPVARPARCLLRGQGAAARLSGVCHRCLCSDLSAGRGHSGNEEGHRRERDARAGGSAMSGTGISIWRS